MNDAAQTAWPRIRAGASSVVRWFWGLPLVVAVVAAFVSPALFLGRVYFLRDAQSWFYPSRLYLRQHLLEGELPRWIPELSLGMPFLADPGNAAVYPPNLLLMLPAPACVGQFLALHVLLAAVGAYHLLQVLGVSKSGRVFGGLSFGTSGYVLSMTSSGVYLLAVAWMPLVAALGLEAHRRANPRRTALFAAALGCQLLAGEPQGVQFTAFLMLALLLAESPRSLRHWRHTALGTLLGVMLAMPTLLPAAGFLLESKRQAGIEIGEASLFSLHPLRLVELLVPGFFGHAHDHANYLGFFLTDERTVPWAASLYCGSLNIVLLVHSLLTRTALRSRWARAVLVLLVLTALLAFGRHTPIFSAYQSLVPGAGYFRYPAKFFALVTLCLTLLGAHALDRLASHPDKPDAFLPWLLAPSAAGLGLLLWFHGDVVTALRAQRPIVDVAEATRVLQDALLPELGVVLLTLLVVIWAGRHARTPPWLCPALTGALVLQVAFANQHLALTAPAALYAAPSPVVARMREVGEPDATRRVYVPADVQPLFMPCLEEFDQQAIAQQRKLVLKMNTGIVDGVHYAGSYTSFASSRFEALWEAAPFEALDLFSVGFALGPNPIRMGESPERRAPCFSIFHNADRLPYARVVSRSIAVSSFEAVLERVKQPAIHRGEVVVLDIEDERTSEAIDYGQRPCEVERRGNETIVLACDAPGRSWVVVNEAYNPNWRATLDGASTSLVRANGLVMAVAVGPGPHTIELRYSEPLFSYGLTIAILAGLVLLGMLFRSASKARREHRSG